MKVSLYKQIDAIIPVGYSRLRNRKLQVRALNAHQVFSSLRSTLPADRIHLANILNKHAAVHV